MTTIKHVLFFVLPALALFVLQASCDSKNGGDEDADAGDTLPDDDVQEDDAGTDPDVAEDDAEDVEVEDVEEEEGNPHIQMLEDLGLNTDPPGPIDRDGNPLPEDYNPFGRKHTVFNPIKEIYFAGFGYNDRHQYLLEDADADFADLYTTEDDSWTGCEYKNVIGADVDGDGRDEVVIVYYVAAETTLHLKVVDMDGGVFVEHDAVVAVDVSEVPGMPEYMPGLAAGDLDDDDRDEVAVTFRNLYVVDDMDAEFEVSVRDYGALEVSRELYVAAGELDGDGTDELVVTYHFNNHAYCDIFDGDLSAPMLREMQLLHMPSLGLTYEQNVHVETGDVDDDQLDELVLFGIRRDSGSTPFLTIMDDARAYFRFFDFAFPQAFMFSWFCHSASLAVGDYNGDGIDDILASNWVVSYEEGAEDFGINVRILNEIFPNHSSCLPPPLNVWMGDVDGDLKEEIIYSAISGMSGVRLNIDGQDTLGDNVNEWNHFISVVDIEGNELMAKAAALNVDNDSPLLEYRDEHELLFGDPTVLAVLAAPPYHADVGQNIDDCGTTFGRTTSSGVESSSSIGFSVGFSIGYEFESIFNIATASFKATVTNAWSWMTSSSMEISKSIAYTGGPDEDKVIFTAVPFDVYYYDILWSPNPDDVGNIMSVNVPREMQTLSVDRVFYNANNGDAPDVDETVLRHVIGDVDSYAGPSERDALLGDGGLMSDASPVGVGSGSIAVTVELTEGQGSGSSYDFEFGIEAELGLGGVTFGTSAAFQYGYEYWETNSESTFFEGTVGDIPSDVFTPDMAYTFGLFAYPFEHEGQKFTVVSYWTE